MNRLWPHAACWIALALCSGGGTPAVAQDKPVYRCPGNPPLYTDQISAKEAAAKGCKTLDGALVTVVSGTGLPRPAAASRPKPSGDARPPEARVDPGEQRSRDNDARKILEDELSREEEKLASLQKEFNDGEPERHGDERNNYDKYLDRVTAMRTAIARKESDIAAIRREIAKLASPAP